MLMFERRVVDLVVGLVVGSLLGCAPSPSSPPGPKGTLALYVDRMGLRPDLTHLTVGIERVDLYYVGRGPAPAFDHGETRCNAPNKTTASAAPVLVELPLDTTGPAFLEAMEAPVGSVTEIRLVLSALAGVSGGKPAQVQTEVTCEDSHQQVVRFLPLAGAPFQITAGATTEVAGELDARINLTPQRRGGDCEGDGEDDDRDGDGQGGDDHGHDAGDHDGDDHGDDHDGDDHDGDDHDGDDHDGDDHDGDGHDGDDHEHAEGGDDGEDACDSGYVLSSTLLAKVPPPGCSFAGSVVVLDPITSPTPYNPVLLSGEARPGGVVQVVGGEAAVSSAVDAVGHFATLVGLVPNTTNRLSVVAVDSCGYGGSRVDLIVVHDDVHPEGRSFPDPFQECSPVTVLLRSPELSTGGSDQLTLALPVPQNLRAPTRLNVTSTVPDVAVGYVAQLVYGTEQQQNVCTYSFVAASGSFALAQCTQMDGARPAELRSGTVTLSLPGISALRSFSVRGELASAAPCPGRPPLSGAKFLDRNGIPDQWLVVLDERAVAPVGVVPTAQRLAALAAGSVLATFSGRPLGFALGASRSGARLVATRRAW